MHIIIQSTLKTLETTKILLDNVSDAVLSDCSIAPYNSSIGSHIRHILDFYACIFHDLENYQVNLTARSRNKLVETQCEFAKGYLETIFTHLKNFEIPIDKTVLVFDDLGLGVIEMSYTYGALLSQANSHTIHHYAIINYILNGLNVKVPTINFGYNPTTPKQNA